MYSNELQSIQQVEETLAQEAAALLYFYNDNCAPCMSLRPKVVELICDKYPKIKIFFVNSLVNPATAAHFHSFSNPTLILFFEGKEYKRLSKYVGIPQLSEYIRKPYFLLFES